MSEYQYYEWQTVDRILTAEEQAAVNRLSSHIDVSSSQAVVTYDWSDFKHDPKEVLLKYFDAHFYLANWGSLRLMFRFPKGLLDEADIEPYCVDEYISFETIGDYQVLDLDFNPEDGGGWMEADAGLSHFIRLRADILDGDYRLLYLAWLKAMTFYGVPDDDEYDEDDPDSPAYDHEPPVPPGLKKLSPALQSFVHVFEIDPFLVQAAAEASPDPKKALAIDYASLVGRLSRSECDDFLTRLAEGEAGVALTLRKRLAAFLPQPEQPQAGQPRTIQQILQRAEQLNKAEQKRQAEAARQRHIAAMKALAAREEQTWRKVEDLLDNGRKIASVYDEATGLLEKLQQLSEFQDTRDIFQQRLRRLAEKYSARSALMGRWHTKGWI
ncbi:MAG: hypothetical protein JW726_07430 [Anaerolineales bacterium]|nr:hypothetical protein [Anaerolineales bacterium]